MAENINALIETWEPRAKAAFLKAIRDHRGRISITRLADRIRAGDADGALREVGLDPAIYRPLDLTITAAYEATGTQAAASISVSRYSSRPALFDIRGFTADSWLRQNNGRMLTDLLSDDGIVARGAIGRAIATGQNPYEAALELAGRVSKVSGLREGGILGLGSREAEWARSYEDDLGGVPSEKALTKTLRDKRFDRTVARAIKEGVPIPADTRRAMINAYRNRAVRFRAEGVAASEAMKAIGAAQIEAYEQAATKGAIEADQVARFWVTKGDSRVRPEHRLIPGMNKDGVGLREPFRTPEGLALYPPLGFGCRCRVRMEIREVRRALAA